MLFVVYCHRCGTKIAERTEPCTVCGGIVSDSKVKMIDFKPKPLAIISKTYNDENIDVDELQNVKKKSKHKSKSSKKIDKLTKCLIVTTILLFLIVVMLATYAQN